MNYLKKIGISTLLMIGIIIVLTFLTSFMYYFNILGSKSVSVIKIIIPFLSFIIAGFIMGRKCNNRGWLEGIKLGLIFILLFLIFNLIFLKYKINIKDFIYYLIF